MRGLAVVLLLLLVLNLCWQTRAEEEEEEDAAEEAVEAQEAGAADDEDEEPSSLEAEGVSTWSLLPNYPEKKLPAGSLIEVLTSFDNKGDTSYTVDMVRASITSPRDYSYYVQNFTGTLYNRTVMPSQEAAFLYTFRPDINMDPREYGLVIQMFYVNDVNETFISTVFNSTVDITDPVSTLDARTLFLYVTLIGAAGLAGFVAWKTMNKPAKGSSSTSTSDAPKAVEVGTGDVDWDYVPAEHLRYLRPSTTAASAKSARKRTQA
eukprot:NODE_917_length_1095_cov_242.512428_g734_i1.p1 GENE.NODE_917_length_1095_cov_242.512428_g734_i1~~NODE_917_length_1095_cov_242.512428_g734_i1.p1  ORF type:complete len:264 (+),score=48.28 NODE_917_length_1095_cov_242.512428_g734_i1:50-841(+)